MITVSMTDIAKMLCVNRTTVWHWRRKGYITPIERVGSPLYDLKAVCDAVVRHNLKASSDVLNKVQAMLAQRAAV